jgi:Protein kinase domain.
VTALKKATGQLYINDAFEDVYEIGSGSFGEVYHARCRSTGKEFAVKKCIRPFTDEHDR